MDKKQCLSAIYSAADKYDECLVDKNLLFVFQEKSNKVDVMETVFKETNFLHLTGIDFTEGNEMSAADFFSHCINRRLNTNMFTKKKGGMTEQKLSILSALIYSSLSAKMIGTYKGGRIRLMTNRLAGGISGSMGFIENGGRYYPNTVLKGDIRDNIDRSRRVLAIFRKDIDAEKYEECTYLAKKVNLSKLDIPEPFRYLANIDNSRE